MVPVVSVLIPTHRRPAIVRRAVHGWLGQRGVDPLEVVVVDDGSPDDEHEPLAREFGGHVSVRLARQANAGRSAARNAAIALARAPWLMFADDDIVPTSHDVLAALLSTAGRQGGAWVPTMSTSDACVTTPLQAVWRRRLEAGAERFRDGAALGPSGFWFASLLLRRSDLAETRFDERFSGYGWEDMEMGWRLHRRGVRVRISHAAAVWHEDPVAFSTVLAKYESYGRQAWTFRALHRSLSVALWTGTAAPIRAYKRLRAFERRGERAAASLRPWIDEPTVDATDVELGRVARDVSLALEGAYARGVRLGAPLERGADGRRRPA